MDQRHTPASPATIRKRGYRAATIAAALAVAGVLVGCSSGGSSSTSSGSSAAGSSPSQAPDLGLITSGTIQAATQSDQYPFAFVGTDGTLQGFSIDLMNAIAGKLGLKTSYKTLSLDPLLSGIVADQYDTAAVGLSETAQREATMGFSEPFYYGYYGMMGKKGSGLKGTASSLSGKTIAVVTGSAQIAYSQQHFPQATLKEFPSQSAALAALLGGQVDAFFLGGPDTIKYLKQNPSLSLVTTIQTNTPNAFPVPKQDTALAKAMNTELNTMFADGEYATIYKKWFTQPIPPALVKEHPSMKTSY